MTLLFVCTGNTCRSPLAEAAWQVVSREAQAELAAAGLGDVTAISAGLSAARGDSAARNGITVARHWGVDMTRHCSRPLTAELAQRADLILTMTRSQAEMVRDRFPGTAPKIRPLGLYATHVELARLESLWPGSTNDQPDLGEGDIEDPYGGTLSEYQECAAQILTCVRQLARELMSEKK